MRSFTPVVKDDPFSGVKRVAEFELAAWALDPKDDSIVGLNLTYDDKLVFSTTNGIVGAINRDFSDLQVIKLGQDEDISYRSSPF